MTTTPKPIQVLIVEDEPHAQKELKRLLAASTHHTQVLHCIDSVDEAIEWINSHPSPDLMFFDIQLSDGLSFEILRHVTPPSPIIFTTAFDNYAIQAFKLNSIDYLLKPVKQEELEAALSKFVKLHGNHKKQDQVLNLDQIEKLLTINAPKYKSRFLSRIGDQIMHIPVSDIAYFMAEDNEVLLVTHQNKKYFVAYALDQLTDLLDPDVFFRANRSFIVSMPSIKKISKYFNSRLHLEVVPTTGEPLLISRVKVPEFLNWIDK